MENATKALLIAAAVLIVIVIIALGVNLLNAGKDTVSQAEQVGTDLDMGIGSSVDKIEGGLEGVKGIYKLNSKNTDKFLDIIGANSEQNTYKKFYINYLEKKECRYLVYDNVCQPQEHFDDLWKKANDTFSDDLKATTMFYDNTNQHPFVFINDRSKVIFLLVKTQ